MKKYLLLLPIFIAIFLSTANAQQITLENAKFYDFTIIEIKNADFPVFIIDKNTKKINPNFDSEVLVWTKKNYELVQSLLNGNNKVTRVNYLKLIPREQAKFTKAFVPFKNNEISSSDYLALKYFKTNNKAPKAGKKVVLLVPSDFYQFFTK